MSDGPDSAQAPNTWPGAQWARVSPASLGWSIALLDRAAAYSARIGSAAVVVMQHGRIVAEWGDTTRNSDIASIRKSLLSALIGIAVQAGRIRLTDTLEALGIDDQEPTLTASEKQATVTDLLTSRSGVYHAVDLEPASVAALRPPRGSHPPGTFWYYNNWDFNALGTIYEQTSRTTIFEAFMREIAGPIGMQDFVLGDTGYSGGCRSIHRHYGFRVSARDLARFGLLYLRGGRWADRQVVPANWVAESTRPHARLHTQLFAGRGYGYMWWTGFHNDFVPTVELPPGSFYGLGYDAQYLFVIPAHDLVVVHTVNLDAEGAPWINDGQIGRFMWLLLGAAGADALGPDTSLAGAPGVRLVGDALRTALAGKTLRFADTAPDGPYMMRLHVDGSASLAKGLSRQVVFTGRWWVDGETLCRGWDRLHPNFDCWQVRLDGETVGLYQEDETMYLQAVVASE